MTPLNTLKNQLQEQEALVGKYGSVMLVEEDPILQSCNYILFQTYLAITQQRNFLNDLGEGAKDNAEESLEIKE